MVLIGAALVQLVLTLQECYAALEDHLCISPPDASVDLQLLPRSKENWSKQMRLLQHNVK